MPVGSVIRSDFDQLAARLLARRAGRRVVGFDVFDTLLRRRVEPEQVKDAVSRWLARAVQHAETCDRVRRAAPAAERRTHPACDWRFVRHHRRQLELELGRAAEARGDDHEFRLRELAPRWLSACGLSDSAAVSPAGLVTFELDCERRATLPTPGITATLAALREAGLRLIYVSDTYLDARDVHALLTEHGLAGFFAAGYCSSTTLRTKRSGRLFAELLAAEGLQPAELLFVGDNPYSDVAAPRPMGIDVLHLRDPGEAARHARLRLLAELSSKNRHWIGEADRQVLETLPLQLRAGRGPDYELGLLLAPAFLGFTRYVLTQARRLGLGRLLFLSREGLTFLKIYRALVRSAAEPGAPPPPSAGYLGVSRIATFLPSLEGLSRTDLHRLLRQYDRQSLRGLLRNLSLPEEEFLPLAAGCGIPDADAPLSADDPESGLTRFLENPEARRRFAQHRDAARARLNLYLRQQGFFSASRIGLVDIGWKGSIQDNLVRAVRGAADAPEVHGLYFGLVHLAEDDWPGSFKHAWLADTRRGDWLEQVVFRNGPVFEMFASAAHGGVIGYRPRRPGAAQVRPILQSDPVERRQFQQYTAEVFAGLRDSVREYLHLAPLLAGTEEDWRPMVIERLRRYILYPTAREAWRFLQYSHMESFGVFHQSTYEFRGSWRAVLLGGGPLGLPRRLIQLLERQFWPEGFLARTRLPLANLLFDLLETRWAGRVRLPEPPA